MILHVVGLYGNVFQSWVNEFRGYENVPFPVVRLG